MRRVLVLMGILVLLLTVQPVQADTLEDSYGSANNDGDELLGDAYNQAAGQAFTPKDTVDISEARFLLRKSGSPTGTAYARLYSITGAYGDTGIPANLLASSTGFDVSTLTTTYTMTSFSFVLPLYRVNEGVRYFIVVDFTGIGNPIALGSAAIDVSNPGHNGNMAEYQVSWNSFSSQDMIFEVYGVNVQPKLEGQGTTFPADQPTDQPPILPVAGGSTLVLIGLGVIAYFGLRGRKRGVP